METILFNCRDILNCNVDVMIRFKYDDVFGNGYFQDVAFQYYEVEMDGAKRKVLEKREVFSPKWEKTKEGKRLKVESLEDTVGKNIR